MIRPGNDLPTSRAAKALLSHLRRLAALAQTGLEPDHPPTANETLDRLTALVAKVLRVPLALVSLVEEDRQAFVGMHGGLPAPSDQGGKIWRVASGSRGRVDERTRFQVGEG